MDGLSLLQDLVDRVGANYKQSDTSEQEAAAEAYTAEQVAGLTN